ncbi:Anaerobic dimethyl sulfoxide reductase chain C [Klebsiella pneumoniae ISC21]|nr:Anaerobic dimethyl sulfoxide reductase chain C [Klebsiella pneumoniae ISC21]
MIGRGVFYGLHMTVGMLSPVNHLHHAVPNHRHDENVLSIDEIFQLKLTSAFINKPAKTIAYYLLSHLFPSSG